MQHAIISRFVLFFIVIVSLVTACEKSLTNTPAEAAVSGSASNNVAALSTRPNIILILGDDVGYEIPTYTGGESYSTPNIDKMAQRGMQFINCYATPLCSPSRFELMTGKYNNRNYHSDSWGKLDLSQRTIANMLRNAGYNTCIAGKWQLDGGDNSIHHFGFDSYSITDPFRQAHYYPGDLNFYKNPTIYRNGKYLSAASMKGKYGEDVNRNYLFRFIDSNKNKSQPFFAMWTPDLCHRPYCPTPDDPEFATWDPLKRETDADTVFLPSMIKYFDKEIGFLMNKLQSAGIAQNTIVLFIVGDNGADQEIHSRWKGSIIQGGKNLPVSRGIHVPMIAYWPGKIAGGQVNNNLVDLTDFLPTIANIASARVPAGFGIIDGVSFANQLFGKSYTPRSSCFCYFDANNGGVPDNTPLKVWAFDRTYKRYQDSLGSFYNYRVDPNETRRILKKNMTKQQRKEDSTLERVIQSYLH